MNERNDDNGGEVMSPLHPLAEQSLAVDLAGVEIDRQIATAHKFPRSLDTVVKKIRTMACYNDAAAENCIYSLPRGGKAIIGPSIGFANILAQSWGNCIDGGRPVYADRKAKEVVAEGVFHDLESNRKTVMHVSRRIANSRGQLYSDDMIGVTGMAAASIARRNAILHAVPRALWFPVYEEALLIVRGDVKTFTENKEKALKSFHQFGIKPEQIVAFLGLKGEADLTLEHIPTLRGAYAALRDGTLTPEEIMDPRRQAAGGFDKVSNPLADEEHDPETGEVHRAGPLGGQPERTAAELKEGRSIHSGQSDATGRGPGPRQDVDGGEDVSPFVGGDGPAANDDAPGGDQAGDVQQQDVQQQPETTKEPAADPKPAETKEAAKPPATKPKAEPKPKADPKPKAADPKPEAAKPAADVKPEKPKTAEEYRDHAFAWIAAGSSATGIEETWRSERDMRTECSVVEDIFDEIKKVKDARKAELTVKA